MDIRSASIDDSSHLSELWKKCGLVCPWNDPSQDIKTALSAAESNIFVGVIKNTIVASVMCGFDGHRGWIYYVAVHPNHQKLGYARRIITEAENWLLGRGCPKILLIIREGNEAVRAIYEKLGYIIEPRSLMSKWLIQPPVSPVETIPQITVAKTHLEMTARPTKAPSALPSLGKPVSLTRAVGMTVSFFRYLYNTIGEQWLWWEKRVMSDEDLFAFINRDGVEFYILSVSGIPAGFVQLTLAPTYDNGAEISYFGLFPEFLGMKLGPYLLDWAVEVCWTHPTKPNRIFLDTCTLDHPSALANYQKSGFVPYKQEVFTIPDPRAKGIIPKNIALPQPEPVI